MFNGILVPNALFLKDEDFPTLFVSKNEFIVESIHLEKEWLIDLSCICFLKIFNINIVSHKLSKWTSLVENNLFGLRQEFCMPGIVSVDVDSLWHEETTN